MRPRDENQQRIYRKSSNMPWWQNACVRAYICDLFIVYVCAQFIEIYRGVYECVFFFRLAFVCSVVLCHFFCCECVLSIVVSFAMRLTAWIFGWKDRKRHTHTQTERMCLIYRRLACCLQSMAKIFRYYAYQGTMYILPQFYSRQCI